MVNIENCFIKLNVDFTAASGWLQRLLGVLCHSSCSEERLPCVDGLLQENPPAVLLVYSKRCAKCALYVGSTVHLCFVRVIRDDLMHRLHNARVVTCKLHDLSHIRDGKLLGVAASEAHARECEANRVRHGVWV